VSQRSPCSKQPIDPPISAKMARSAAADKAADAASAAGTAASALSVLPGTDVIRGCLSGHLPLTRRDFVSFPGVEGY
jgi:hypothetical protein